MLVGLDRGEPCVPFTSGLFFVLRSGTRFEGRAGGVGAGGVVEQRHFGNTLDAVGVVCGWEI